MGARGLIQSRHPHQGVTVNKKTELALNRIVATAADLPPDAKGKLAGMLLADGPLCREAFDAFWTALDDHDQEELASWVGLRIDGDEHEAALVG